MNFPTLWYFGKAFDWKLVPNDSYKPEVTDSQELSQIVFFENKKYFVKVQSASNPELPFVEYLCNMIAYQVGLDIAPFGIVSLDCKYSFVSEDFLNNGKIESKFLYDFIEPQIVDLEQIVHSVLGHGVKVADILPMFAVWMYDALIGNNDRHACNMMFIRNREDWILSPSYDNHSHLGLNEKPDNSLKISKPHIKDNKSPTVADIVAEGKRLGFDVSFYKSILSQKEEVLKIIRGFQPIGRERKKALREYIINQYRILEEYHERNN